MKRFISVGALVTLASQILIHPALAQRATPPSHDFAGGTDRRTGFELELHGTAAVAGGRQLALRGVAYEVIGLATLRPLPTASVRVFEVRDGVNSTQSIGDATADGSGHFSLNLPSVSMISVRVGIAGTTRDFLYNIDVHSPNRLELLTDRVLYEPGETVHAWIRLTDISSSAPIRGTPIEISVGGDGALARQLGAVVARTSEGGIASLDVPIPLSAPDGSLAVHVRTDDPWSSVAQTFIRVGRRTVERLMAIAQVDQTVVAPSARVTGHVTVRTPSGAPVRNARVEIRVSTRDEPVVTETNAQGIAAFSTFAPAYLAQPIAQETLDVRVVHRAYGTVRTSVSFTMARAPYSIEAISGAGEIVPEVTTPIYVTLSDPRGEPPHAGTHVTVTGEGVSGHTFHGTTDSHGIVSVPMRLPRGAAARHDQGTCAGRVATSFDVSVDSDVPITARLCVAASLHAEVIPRVTAPIVAPGGGIDVSIERAPSSRTRPIAIDLMHRGDDGARWTVLASSIVPPGSTHAVLTAPIPYVGVALVRARPINAAGSAEGTGAFDSVLIRPAHAFSLSIEPERAQYNVRQTAHLTIHSPAGAEGGHVALVARDLSAHGGEQPFALSWLRGEVSASVANPATPDAERLVRVALAAFAARDLDTVLSPPLIPSVGARDDSTDDATSSQYDSARAAVRGDLRDPFALRDELLRRGLNNPMRVIEQALDQSLSAPSHGIVTEGPRRSFDPTIVHTLIDNHALGAQTLGGGEMTLAMIQAADSSFTFDHVARRVARVRLVRLLSRLAVFLGPDTSSRDAASTEPAERWLSRMVERGIIVGSDLLDPWGGTFGFRRVTPGRETVAIDVRSAGWELSSPGPDRIPGNADDVRNPFERIVPEGTVYAISSGEDDLMRRLAALDPGSDVLVQIAAAYGRVGRGASEEQTGEAAGATTSEVFARNEGRGALVTASDDEPATAAAPPMLREMPAGQAEATIVDAIGGERRAAGPDSFRNPSAHAAPPPPEPTAGSAPRVSQLAALVRERFPATLRFAGESPLNASGATVLDVPLADALTTYRIEAIAWTSEGWTTSASTDVQVEQDAVVDAPVPPFAVVGDAIRLPLRVSNRTQHAIRARVDVHTEGDLHLDVGAAGEATVAPGDASEVSVLVRARATGHGFLVVTAVDAATGQPLDAARRPIEVLADARPVRMAAEALVDGHATLNLDVPRDATFRAEGGVRITVGQSIFGDPREWGQGQADPTWPGWAIAMGGVAPPVAIVNEMLAPFRTAPIAPDAYGVDAAAIARAISALWYSEAGTDEMLSRGLAAVTRGLDSFDHVPRQVLDAGGVRDTYARQHAAVLLGLVPAALGMSRRPSLVEPLHQLLARMRRSIESNTATTTDDPGRFALASAALGLTSSAPPSLRVLEFMRRAARGLNHVGDDSFIDPSPGDPNARVEPSATYGLAALASGDRPTAFSIARTLAHASRTSGHWSLEARSLATALLNRLAPPSLAAGHPTVRIGIDGHVSDVALINDVASVSSREISMPGHHRVEVTLPPGTTLITEVESRYGRPWNVAAPANGPFAVTLEGAVGVRDARSALVLRVQNRGPRVLASPIIEIDLPAGTELDEDTRREIQRRIAHTPVLEGRTLVLPLRAMAPGSSVRIPLGLRWSVGGELRGLGLTAYVSQDPGAAATILPSRTLTIPDTGPEPTAAVGGRR